MGTRHLGLSGTSFPISTLAASVPAARNVTVATPGHAAEGCPGAEDGMIIADADGYAAFPGITVSIRLRGTRLRPRAVPAAVTRAHEAIVHIS